MPFLLTCWKVNLAGAMEFRMSFFMTAGMMFLNNMIWMFFWSLFFNRFPTVNGWQLQDVMLMWAVGTAGFGWTSVLLGNYNRIAAIAASGQLDVYLTQPKPVLLHVLASRMSLTAIGDFLFGLCIYAFVGDFSPGGLLRFALGVLIAGLIFLFFNLGAGSLAFYIGNAEGLSFQLFNSFIMLTTYPTDIFKGFARIILFTAVPAGFISYMPIGLLRGAQPGFVYGSLIALIFLAVSSLLLFHRGLRRYSSGNLTGMRSG
ncbi:hypothetical protein VN24_19750 [Paenibacillus beijingensis]|uniref:ABC transporter permease n=1 Tax=Paenibacillus beijingensis TaxID=1126833 RepID=A0A0D5NRT8_9BACL|nr:hypothetical protein VN24_19750 [Paenibacillus beijingensis]